MGKISEGLDNVCLIETNTVEAQGTYQESLLSAEFDEPVHDSSQIFGTLKLSNETSKCHFQIERRKQKSLGCQKHTEVLYLPLAPTDLFARHRTLLRHTFGGIKSKVLT